MRIFTLLIALVALGACGGSTGTGTVTSDGGPSDSATSDAIGTKDDATGLDSASSDAVATDSTATEAGSDVKPSDGGFSCGDKNCATGELCTRTYTTGGACAACSGAGDCPSGRTCSGGCCVSDTISYSYLCKTKPSSCTGTLACGGACATAICSGACPCESASGSTITCHCLAP